MRTRPRHIAACLVALAVPAATAQAHHGPSTDHLPPIQQQLDLVGQLEPRGEFGGDVLPEQIADLAVHKGFAYLNSWDSPVCERGGTYVVDIRNPADPQEIGFIPASFPYYHGEGAHVISMDTPEFTGDVLAVNDETYGSNVAAPDCSPVSKEHGGFDLYDVSDPHHPQALVRNFGDQSPDDGTVEPDPLEGAGNSYHSVFIWQSGPNAYLVASDNIELHDVDIFDITDPRNPIFIAEYDLVEEFPEIVDGEQANLAQRFLHDMVVKRIGDRQVLLADYWDAGYVQLDITDPLNPTLITDTTFSGEDPVLPGSALSAEGNAHQGEFSFDNQFVLAADEDFGTHRTSGRALSGPTNGRTATMFEPTGAPVPIGSLPDEKINGPSVFVGDGCDPAVIPAAPPDDGNPNTEDIALVERGGVLPGTDPPVSCGFVNKYANVVADGWDAILVFNQVRPDDFYVNMATDSGSTIPGAQMRRVDAFGAAGVLSTGTATPAPGTAGPALEVSLVFDGWGYAHLYDAATSEQLDTFAIPQAHDERFAAGFGTLSIHEFATDPTEPLAYSSYYAGGVRVFGFDRANGLVQRGAFIDPEGSNFWGIEQYTTPDGERLIAGSDRDYGLQIFRYTGTGAPQPPSCESSSVTTTPGTAVRVPLTCTDPNGNALTLRVTDQPDNGNIEEPRDGAVTYTPNAGFTGNDALTFVANDGAADSDPVNANIEVSEAAAPSNRFTARLGRYRNGRLVVIVNVPGPGSLGVGFQANLPSSQASAARFVRLRRVSRRVTEEGDVRVTLKPSKANARRLRRALRRSGRVRAKVNIAFKPTGGTTRRSTRRLTIRR